MDKDNKFIKENLIYFLIPIIIFAAGAYYSYDSVTKFLDNRAKLEDKRAVKTTKETKYAQLKAAKERQENRQTVEKTSSSGKVIYEVLGQQFSPEASFGIMFENVLSNMTNNGVRIRSIDYNYSPVNDKVLQTGAVGYNGCELSFTTVASYPQLQNFFKSLAKENYLTNIYEVYIEPYDKNKSILIAKFKVRLYTKTVHS